MARKLSGGARTRRDQLRMERLENKALLAGEVLVNVVGGHLLITGDAEANQIAVSSGEDPGSFVIRGLDGTTVSMADAPDGTPPGSELTVEGVRGNVRIATGDGDDVVRINRARFARSLAIGTGEGNDTVLIGVPAPSAPAAAEADGEASAEEDPAVDANVAVRGSVRIATFAGEDVVRVADTAIGGHLAVLTGADSDRVVLGADPETPPAEGGAATDELVAESEETDGDAPDPHLLRARGGILVSLGAGDDAASLRDVGSRRGVAVGGDGGSDRIALSDVDAGFSLLVNGGRGDATDNVVLDDVRARFAAVRTGDGADRVRIADSAFAALAVSTGGGDDIVGVAGTKARVAVFLGGPGEDTLNEGEGNEFGTKIVRNFEIPAPPTDGGASGDAGAGPTTAVLPRLVRRARVAAK